jgi:hypothetical protein
MNFSNGVYVHPVTRGPGLLGGIAEDINDGAIFVKRGALASSGSTRNVLYLFGGQLAGAHTIQYPVQRALLQHNLLLF